MIPDSDDFRKKVFLVLQARFEARGTTMTAFEKDQGYGRAYLARIMKGRRDGAALRAKMAEFLELPSADFPFGIEEKDFEPIRQKLLERQISVVGEDYRGEVDIKSLDWGSMTPKLMEDLVWKHPSSVVGLMCGVSDVAIGKYCKKHGIKKPPRGYWAKQGRFKPNPSGR